MQDKKKRAPNRPHKQVQGLPSREDILQFIQTADGPAGKRELAKAFGLKGQEKIALKALLKDMAEEGLIDGRDVYHGDDEATPVPGVPARTALVGPQCVVNGGGASGATSKAPRWNSSPTVSCGSECCASSVNAA